MFKRSARYFALALTLVALTATVRPARAYALADDDPCTDPTTGCIVGSSTPQPPPPPTGQAVPQNSTDPDGDSADGSQSLDNLIAYLMVLYGLA